ncbi:DinB family protein [Lutibacter sp.]
MEYQFNILNKTRKLILNAIENLTLAQLNKIPTGFNNNIVWNVGHLVVTQQLLCYKLSGVNCLVSDEMIERFQKGAKPSGSVSQEELETLKNLFLELPLMLEEDYANEKFQTFHSYHTSVDISINNIDEAIEFNSYHEGIHLGIILQLIKFV